MNRAIKQIQRAQKILLKKKSDPEVIKEIEDNLKSLNNDFKSQIKGLESSRKDVAWNCYSVSNWQELADSVTEIRKLLKQIKKV